MTRMPCDPHRGSVCLSADGWRVWKRGNKGARWKVVKSGEKAMTRMSCHLTRIAGQSACRQTAGGVIRAREERVRSQFVLCIISVRHICGCNPTYTLDSRRC